MTQTLSSALKTAKSKTPTHLKQRFRRNSFGIRLFSMIMGGAALSIASVAFMFDETVKFQAEDQIQKVLDGKVSTIQEITDRAENLAYSLGVSASTLHVRRAETPETYQELTRQLFERQPDYILGLGFGQKENGILPNLEWFYPYYQVDSIVEGSISESAEGAAFEPTDTSAVTGGSEVERANAIRYTDRAEAPYSYPKSEVYRTYFLSQKSLWTAPYQSDRGMLLTYYSQIYDNQQEWLGTAVVDVDEAYLQAVLNEPVYKGGGSLFLLAEDGQVIANPLAPDEVIDQTYADIPGLTEVWPQIRGMSDSGLLEGRNGYWSYLPIADQSWVVVSYVPYQLVFGRIVAITIGAVLLAGLIMAGVTALALRYLNNRLRPVINECQRLSIADEEVNEQLVGKDELAQLSISFFNLLEQLQLTQAQVKLEAAHATEVETQLKQIKRKTSANQRRQYQNNQPIDVSVSSSDSQSSSTSLVDSASTSAGQLQQELAQLNETVSSLAADNWLVDVLKDKRGELLPATELSELNQISAQLGDTFIQVLSALNQFSHLLSAFGETYEHVLTIEQEMNSARRDAQSQAEVVDHLQEWTQEHEVFCTQLMRSTQKNAAITDPHSTSSTFLGSSDRLDLTMPTVQSFRQTTQQLSQSLRSLFLEIDNIDRKSKQYQRINTAAQVLISNASTLSISASRQRDPEVFDDILSQLRDNGIDLEGLARQLEDAQSQHQQSATQVESLSVSLRIGMDAVDRIAKKLDDLANSVMASQPQQPGLPAVTSKGLRSTTPQQLAGQLDTLRNSLEEMASLTVATNQYISKALQATSQVRQIGTEVPLALPSNAESAVYNN